MAMVLSLAIIAPVAPADPVGPPQFRALAGGGAFTTQGVLNALSDVVTIDGVKQIASYDARRGTEQVVTKDPEGGSAYACCRAVSTTHPDTTSSMATTMAMPRRVFMHPPQS